jgi:hypothetical protein
MLKTKITSVLCVLALWMGLAPRQLAIAANGPQFTPHIGGGFLRAQPMVSAPVGAPVFNTETYPILARTATNAWVKLDTTKGQGWLLAQYGSTTGDLTTVPVETLPPSPARRGGASNAWGEVFKFITPITPKAKKLYQAKAPNKNPGVFTVVGDCNSVPEAYQGRVAMGLFDVNKHPALIPAAERFSWSFTRNSQAAFRGFNSTSMFDPVWANPNFCQPGEGVLPCELRRSQASIAFVALGTGDQFTWKDFEKNYRGIIDYLIKQSVLPVLVTKADDLELQQGGAPAGAINTIVRKLGAEYGLPVIDFYAATRGLPKFGMRDEGNENFHMSAEGSDTRILLTLQVLDAVMRK